MTTNQLKVMKVLWNAHNPVSPSAIAQETEMIKGRVVRILTSLEKKNMVRRSDEGFSAAKSVTEFTDQEVKKMIDALYDGNFAAFLKDYITMLDHDELMALKEMLKKKNI